MAPRNRRGLGLMDEPYQGGASYTDMPAQEGDAEYQEMGNYPSYAPWPNSPKVRDDGSYDRGDPRPDDRYGFPDWIEKHPDPRKRARLRRIYGEAARGGGNGGDSSYEGFPGYDTDPYGGGNGPPGQESEGWDDDEMRAFKEGQRLHDSARGPGGRSGRYR